MKNAFRQASQYVRVELKGLSTPRSLNDDLGTTIFYAQCRSHKCCGLRVMAAFDASDQTLTVSGHGQHSDEQAAARQDAAIPMTRGVATRMKNILESSLRRKMTPLEVADELAAQRVDGVELPPGRSTQNLVKQDQISLSPKDVCRWVIFVVTKLSAEIYSARYPTCAQWSPSVPYPACVRWSSNPQRPVPRLRRVELQRSRICRGFARPATWT